MQTHFRSVQSVWSHHPAETRTESLTFRRRSQLVEPVEFCEEVRVQLCRGQLDAADRAEVHVQGQRFVAFVGWEADAWGGE